MVVLGVVVVVVMVVVRGWWCLALFTLSRK